MAYSVAPLLYGFKNFNKELKIAGVIFNQVNTESHYEFLKQACQDVDIESLGYIPVNEEIKIPSRHLGLSISSENDYEAIINKAALHIQKTVNIDKLLEKTLKETVKPSKSYVYGTNKRKLTIAIAMDEAFNFTYHENLEALKGFAHLTYFSPLHDTIIPPADFVYIAGGYPELYLDKLASNERMKNSVLNYCNSGGKLLAECGGMMYLGKDITDKEGNTYPMAGYLDLSTSMLQSKLHLGYREVLYNNKIYKGHEFHYSTASGIYELTSIGKVINARKIEVDTKVYKKQEVVASYIHFYWGENKELLKELFSLEVN